jgi:hypothetical protein
MSATPLLVAVVVGVAAAASPTPMGGRTQGDAPIPVRVFLDQARYAPGSQGRVRVAVGQPGYLLVLYAEPEGHVQIAYPIDPGDPDAVRPDTNMEILGRGGRASFTVDDSSGEGTWYAAISAQPFRFDSVVVNGHWDYRAVPRITRAGVEADLTSFVEGIATARFDYDLVTFTIDTLAGLSTSSASTSAAAPDSSRPARPPEPTDPGGPGPWIGPGFWWPGWPGPWGLLPPWPGPYYDRATPGGAPDGQHLGGTSPPTRPEGKPPSETRDRHDAPSPRGGHSSGDRNPHGRA